MSTDRLEIRQEAVKRGWSIEVDDGHHFRANRRHWILSVWYTRDGKVLISDLVSPIEAKHTLTSKAEGKADIILTWLAVAG